MLRKNIMMLYGNAVEMSSQTRFNASQCNKAIDVYKAYLRLYPTDTNAAGKVAANLLRKCVLFFVIYLFILSFYLFNYIYY